MEQATKSSNMIGQHKSISLSDEQSSWMEQYTRDQLVSLDVELVLRNGLIIIMLLRLCDTAGFRDKHLFGLRHACWESIKRMASIQYQEVRDVLVAEREAAIDDHILTCIDLILRIDELYHVHVDDANKTVKAVGEIGLDFYRNISSHETPIAVCEMLIHFAREHYSIQEAMINWLFRFQPAFDINKVEEQTG